MDLENVSRFRAWYDTPVSKKESGDFTVAAYEDAVKRFSADLTHDNDKIHSIKGTACLKDVQDSLSQSLTKYEASQTHTAARKWLHKVALRIHFYGNVLDIIAQHHPEYVSLAWGAMKFLLQAVINHEKILAIIPKALSQIADSLPRVELASIMYPTERMKAAISELYAHILRFLIRARDWYEEGTLRRWLHSLARPAELRYSDLLEQIAQSSRFIDQLAAYGSQAEIRDMNSKLDMVLIELDRSSTVVNNLKTSLSSIQMMSSALLDTNKRLTDLQLAQIISAIPQLPLGDPIKVLQHHRSLQHRRILTTSRFTSNRFWLSPKLQQWSNSLEPSISIVKGNYLSRFTLRDFCVNVINQLRASNLPFLLAMRTAIENPTSANISTIDLLKSLVRQALQIHHGIKTEKSMALSCTRFQTAATEAEWFQLLESVLAEMTYEVYLVIDIEILDQELAPLDGFSLLSAFTQFFNSLSSRGISARVKVLFVSYGSSLPFYLSEEDSAKFVVSAKTNLTPARQRERRRQDSYAPRGWRGRISSHHPRTEEKPNLFFKCQKLEEQQPDETF